MIWILLFLAALVLHELAHGLAAYALGDPTAKQAGRLTLNPLKHIDLFWTVLLPALMFFSTQGRFAMGMAKPVPVDFSRLHRPKQDMIWVALAGPAANIFLALLLRLALELYKAKMGILPAWTLYAIYFNLGLACFNLIPIPPLDGSRVLAGLLPLALARRYLLIEPFGFLLILGLYLTGVLFTLLAPVMDFLCEIMRIPSLGEF